MRAAFCFHHRKAPQQSRVPATRVAAFIFVLACTLALVPIELGGQGSKPAAPPKQPKITSLVTDRTEFALSPNFGAAGAYSINQAGDLAFVSGGSALFVRRAGATSAARVLQMADPAPGFADTRCDLISSPMINSAGHVAFHVDFNPLFGMIRSAIYVWGGATFHRVAYSMDPAPGGGGAAFGRGITLTGFNDAGLVAFNAPLIPVTGIGLQAQPTLYVTTVGATPTRIAGRGDPAPGTGGTFDNLSGGTLNSAGEVLFTAAVTDGHGGAGVFVGSTYGVRKVVSHGDPLPAPMSGTFDFITNGLPTVRFNNAGQVAFAYRGEIFMETLGVVTLAVRVTDPVPAPPGGWLGTSTLLTFNDAGQVAFSAIVNGAGMNNRGLFRYTPGSPLDVVAYRNMPAPGTGGALFNTFSTASMNAGGLMTFHCAGLMGGSVSRGIFQQRLGAAPWKVVVDGDLTPLRGGGTLGLALSTATQTLNDGAALFSADVLDGASYAGTFLARGISIASLTSTEDPLPAGSRVSLRTFGVGTSGSSVVFRALRTGGQESLWLCDVRAGRPVRVVADGDPIPGMPGRLRNQTTSMMKMNAAGDVAFLARLIGGPGYGGTGIFVRTRAGALEKIVAQGDPDLATGRTFTSIAWNSSPPEPFNNSAQVAFRATLAGTTTPNPSGVFVGAPGTVPVTVALTGLPGPYTAFSQATMNNRGQVAFRATTASGSGFYVATPGNAPEKVVATADPGPGGSTFPAAMPGQFAFTDLGEAVFMTTLNGGPGGGLFVATAAGGPVPVVLNGSSAPPGGTFVIPSTRPDYHTNGSGDVVFRATLSGGPADSGLFLVRRAEGVLRTILVQGQVAPGTGATFATLSGALNLIPGETASLTAGGEVWTSQLVVMGSEYVLVHFRFDKDNQLEKVFARGDKAPQSNGGTLVATIQLEPPGIDANGLYYFFGGIVGGKVSDAIYVTR